MELVSTPGASGASMLSHDARRGSKGQQEQPILKPRLRIWDKSSQEVLSDTPLSPSKSQDIHCHHHGVYSDGF